MSQNPEEFEFTAFAFETLDPTDYETIGKVVVQILASEGPLVRIAAGDPNYLRFLRDDAIAQLDLRINPDDEDVLEQARRTHDTLHAYEAHIRTEP
jgi:hypothetical protein